MCTYCAIAAPSRHPRGEPRSPSPTNPSLTAAPIPSLPTSQPTHSRRPLASAFPFPPRSPFVVPGDVGDLGGHGDLDARPASHAPARFVATPGRLVVAPSGVRIDRRDQAASLQVHWNKQLRSSVAQNEFRDTCPSTTQLAPLFTANWSVAKTDSAHVCQQNKLADMADMADSPKPALLPRRACRVWKRIAQSRPQQQAAARQPPTAGSSRRWAERFGSLSAMSDVESPRRRSDSPRQNPPAGTMMLAAPALPPSPAADPQVQARLELAVAAAQQPAPSRSSGSARRPSPSSAKETARPSPPPTAPPKRSCEKISAQFPDDAILGEEFGEKPGTSPYRWVLDPIDGTKSFISGVPLYTTLVAVMKDDQPLIGVIYAPATDEIVYAAVGGPTWYAVGDGEPIEARVSHTGRLAEATFVTTEVSTFDRRGNRSSAASTTISKSTAASPAPGATPTATCWSPPAAPT